MPHQPDSNVFLPIGSAEWWLLVSTARLHLADHRLAELERLLRQEIDWDKVVPASIYHGTAGLLLKHLLSIPAKKDIPAAVIDRLQSFYLRMTAMGMKQLAQFQEVAEALNQAGVELITLKGAVLAETLYGDLGLRPLSDVDVIARESDWQEICNVLAKLNYKSLADELKPLPPKLTRYDVKTHVQFVSPAGTYLEFQFDLFTVGIGMRDMAGVWDRSRWVEIGGVGRRVLGAEDQLLHLLVHANRHGCSRLKWIVDINEYLNENQDLDWNLFASIAQREKVISFVFQTLVYIEQLFDTPLISHEVLEQLRPNSFQQALWRAVWPRRQLYHFRGRDEDAICYYFYKPFSGWNLINFALAGRVRDKIGYQARWIVPSFDWMAQVYQQPKSLGLIKYYPLRLMERSRSRSQKKQKN